MTNVENEMEIEGVWVILTECGELRRSVEYEQEQIVGKGAVIVRLISLSKLLVTEGQREWYLTVDSWVER